MSDKKAEYSAPSHPPQDDGETRPLPEGWMKQYDSNSNAWFYVDTKASPPRSIWVHPYDDAHYLEKNPDAKAHQDRHSYAPPSSPPPVPSSSRPSFNEKGKAPEKRGFLGKIKDKALGTKEEREAAKRQRERERQERFARQQAHAAQYGAPPQFYQQHPQQGQFQQGYGPGQPMHGQQPVYVQQQPQRGGFGGGGMAMPLMGGMAGGLLLGSALGGDGFGGDGGDFGGGDFGGGDFGGGGF